MTKASLKMRVVVRHRTVSPLARALSLPLQNYFCAAERAMNARAAMMNGDGGKFGTSFRDTRLRVDPESGCVDRDSGFALRAPRNDVYLPAEAEIEAEREGGGDVEKRPGVVIRASGVVG